MTISKQLQPFTAISWNFRSFMRHSVPFWKYMNSHYFILQRVLSWNSVPILLCSEMQAPHWSQSQLLDSQCVSDFSRRFLWPGTVSYLMSCGHVKVCGKCREYHSPMLKKVVLLLILVGNKHKIMKAQEEITRREIVEVTLMGKNIKEQTFGRQRRGGWI